MAKKRPRSSPDHRWRYAVILLLLLMAVGWGAWEIAYHTTYTQDELAQMQNITLRAGQAYSGWPLPWDRNKNFHMRAIVMTVDAKFPLTVGWVSDRYARDLTRKGMISIPFRCYKQHVLHVAMECPLESHEGYIFYIWDERSVPPETAPLNDIKVDGQILLY